MTEAIQHSSHVHPAALVASGSSDSDMLIATTASLLGDQKQEQEQEREQKLNEKIDDNMREQQQHQLQQQQQQQQQTHNLIDVNYILNNFNFNSNNIKNNSNNNNNNDNNQNENMSASVNNVCKTSNILNINTSNNSNNNNVEMSLSKNNANMQTNNSNNNNLNENIVCNINNKCATSLTQMVAPTITTTTTTANNNNNNNNGNNNNGNGCGSGKNSPATTISATLTCGSPLTTALSSASNTTITNNNNNTATSLLLRKQFIASSDGSNASFSSASVAGSIQDDMSDQCSLTQAGLEEYNIRASSYYDQPAMLFHHQKQSSYAQSEGYHSYVSSSDSSSATPFLDRLRQESEMLSRQSSHHWSQNDLSSVSCASMASSPTPLLLATIGRDAANSGSGSGSNQHQQQQQHNNNNNSSESTSSTETLKWLGSMSDVSEASHATGYSAISESLSSSQLIVHSSRVLTPKRHHSESILYLHDEHQQQRQQLQQQNSISAPTSTASQPHSPSAPMLDTKQISPTLSARSEHTQNLALLLPNHRHSPSYPPVHATASMHPYQPHPQYALRQQPQCLSHKLINAFSKTDATVPSSFSVNTEDSFNPSSLVHTKTSSSPSPQQVIAETQSSTIQTSTALNISVTAKQSHLTTHTSLALQSPDPMSRATVSSSADNISLDITSGALSTDAAGSPDSTKSQLNASSTSLASTMSGAVFSQQTQSYRGNHRLFPVSTYTEKVQSNTSQFVLHPKPQFSADLQKPTNQQQQQPVPEQSQQQGGAKYMLSSPSTPPNPSWQSVAELINDFERTKNEPQSQKYTYMDPNKTHRVSNPALKAFQKNAVQSYFERQQQQQQQQQMHAKDQGPLQKAPQPIRTHSQYHNQQQHSPSSQSQQHSPPEQIHHQLLRPHSYQSNMKESAAQYQVMRNSLPNSYGASSNNHLNDSEFHQQQQATNTQQLRTTRLGSVALPPPPPPQKPNSSNYSGGSVDGRVSNLNGPLSITVSASQSFSQLSTNPPSPAPPPPPPRSRSLLPHTLLRRSSSASDYAEFRDQYTRATQEKLVAQSIKNISKSEKSSFNDCGMPPPPPPPRGSRSINILNTRRTSSAAEYAAAMREKALLQQAAALAHQQHHPHQHARPPNYAAPQYHNPPPPPLPHLTNTIEPGWVPERPPKNPNLRVPSPDLPPLPPSGDLDTQLADEPLPPPPPELLQQQQQQQQQRRQQYQHQQQQPLQNYFDLNATMHASIVELLPKAPSPNRRNSFAGSSTRKSYFGRTDSELPLSSSSSSSSPLSQSVVSTKMPPLIPKKPSIIEPQHAARHQLQQQHAQQLNKKCLLNVGMSQQHSPPLQQQSPSLSPHALSPTITNISNAKLSANRKRAHNPALSGFSVPPPIMENVQQQQQQSAHQSPSNAMKSSQSPPPLMPRSISHQQLFVSSSCNNSNNNNNSSITSNNTIHTTRCNSKASYLPRQSLEKLNNLDPDHGSYKLTLTSNEDLVGNTKPTTYDILNTHNGKLPPNNLPDVLPLGAKLQPQPSSPTSANASPLRYGSNNNLNVSNMSAPTQQAQQQQQQQPVASINCYPAYPPTQHRYSTPTMHSCNSNVMGSNNTANKASHYGRSQSHDVHNNNNSPHSSGNNLYYPNPNANNSPTKFMSQSTMDLKRTQLLEPTLEETTAALLNENATVLSPAQSEGSLSASSPNKYKLQQQKQMIAAMKPLSRIGSSSESGSGSGSTSGSEGRIFRAELVTATLSTSPNGPSKPVIRKDSLRENIEKITQLQSKLMSAHLSETSLIGCYGSKTALNTISAGPTTENKQKTIGNMENMLAQTKESSSQHTTSVCCSSAEGDSKVEGSADPNANYPSITDVVSDKADTSSPPQMSNGMHLDTASAADVTLPHSFTIVANTNTSSEDIIATQMETQLNPNTDGLKLMQRSEIILRVNPSTTEAASQTDDDLVSTANDTEDHTRLTEQPHTKEDVQQQQQQQRITLQPRQRHAIEIDCEEMSMELATLLASNEKLVQILAPVTVKSPTDYVSNLYNPNVPLRPAKRDVGTSTLLRMKGRDNVQEKVLVELQYADMEVLLTNGESEPESSDVLKKKVNELIKQLYRKISILNKEQVALKEETEINDELGNSLVIKLTDKVRPIEATKCRTYIDDVGQITSLLLSLSERLARIENSLSIVSAQNSAEKKSLEIKRDRLLDQLAEAKRLKEDIERRGSSVFGIVEKNLSADEFADFDYFINMKAKLIADSRDIADKIKCGEEQLHALSEALIQTDC